MRAHSRGLRVGVLLGAAALTLPLGPSLAAADPPSPTSQGIQLMSARPDGTAGGGFAPVISADGSKVAFYSEGALVAGDTNGNYDVYVRDLTTGETIWASQGADGAVSNGRSWNVGLSGNGRYVAFDSGATNLVAGSTGGGTFVRDLETGTTTRLPVGGDNFDDTNYFLSADGQRIAYSTYDGGVGSDGWVYDRSTGRETPVGPKGRVRVTGLSGDGTRVLFSGWGAYVHDLATGVTTDVTAGMALAPGDVAFNPSISSDGAAVAFLVQTQETSMWRVWVRDLLSGAVRPVTPADEPLVDPTQPVVSNGGKYVVYGDGRTIVRRDMVAGTDQVLSVGVDGAPTVERTRWPGISSDGARVVFHSRSADLVPGDTNGGTDVFLWAGAVPESPALVATSPPTWTGQAIVGSTLSASPGEWNLAGLGFAYQWLRDGAPIAGATNATYAVTTDDVGHALAVRVTATGPQAQTAVSTSASTATVPKVRAVAKTRLPAKQAKRAKRGKAFKVTVVVRTPGTRAAGKVRLKVVGTKAPAKVRKGWVRKVSDRGRVTFKVPGLPLGSYRIVARYVGTQTIAKAKAKPVRFRVS